MKISNSNVINAKHNEGYKNSPLKFKFTKNKYSQILGQSLCRLTMYSLPTQIGGNCVLISDSSDSDHRFYFLISSPYMSQYKSGSLSQRNLRLI